MYRFIIIIAVSVLLNSCTAKNTGTTPVIETASRDAVVTSTQLTNLSISLQKQITTQSDLVKSLTTRVINDSIATKKTIKSLQDSIISLNAYKGSLDTAIFKKVKGVITIPAIPQIKGVLNIK